MDLYAVNQPEPQRFAIELGAGWMVMVLVSPEGEMLMGFFLEGELIHTVNHPAGQA